MYPWVSIIDIRVLNSLLLYKQKFMRIEIVKTSELRTSYFNAQYVSRYM